MGSLSCVGDVASILASLLADGPLELRHYAAHSLANLANLSTPASSCTPDESTGGIDVWGLPALAAAVGTLLDGPFASSCHVEEDLLRLVAHLAPRMWKEAPETEANTHTHPSTHRPCVDIKG